MPPALINRDSLILFLNRLSSQCKFPGKIYLIGDTTRLLEGWTHWIPRVEFCSSIESSYRGTFKDIVAEIHDNMKIRVEEEFPGDLIPLPDGYEERAIPIFHSPDNGIRFGGLKFFHFDPYSTAFRFIARGDEVDYHLVLDFLRNQWIQIDMMEQILEDLLPRFSFTTIQQDPAEFRRKYKGLLQMWRASQNKPVSVSSK